MSTWHQHDGYRGFQANSTKMLLLCLRCLIIGNLESCAYPLNSDLLVLKGPHFMVARHIHLDSYRSVRAGSCLQVIDNLIRSHGRAPSHWICLCQAVHKSSWQQPSISPHVPHCCTAHLILIKVGGCFYLLSVTRVSST